MLIIYETRKRNPLATGNKGRGWLYLVVSYLTRERERERGREREREREGEGERKIETCIRIHDKTRLVDTDA